LKGKGEEMKDKTKKYYDVIIKDRKELSDYERDQLIPELKSRLDVIKSFFNEIINTCDNHFDYLPFKRNLDDILNPNSLPSIDNNDNLSDIFFNEIKRQSQEDFINNIETVLNKYNKIVDFKSLGLFMTEVNFLCSVLMNTKNILFLYKIVGYPNVKNLQTGEIKSNRPAQYELTIEPFQIAIDNIFQVAKSTSETIHEWHKQVMQSKTQFVDLYNAGIKLRNSKLILFIQILTIILTISLSFFFSLAKDPFNLVKENSSLRNKIILLEQDSHITNHQTTEAPIDTSKNK
jgi:hypothetical protein